jgi:hypothetical protein
MPIGAQVAFLSNRRFHMTFRFVRHDAAGRTERGSHIALPRMSTGIDRVAAEEHRGWQIEITHRQVGVVMQRHQFTAAIRMPGLQAPQLLSGFTTKDAALKAAKDSINFRIDAAARRIPESQQVRGKA